MREIKFRGWDGREMIYNLSPSFGEVWVQEYDTSTFSRLYNGDEPLTDKDLMQFTGLLDKNGVPIYDGDIVKYTVSIVPLVEEVYETVWYQAGFAFKKLEDDGHAIYLQTSRLEVIGNIYEHPHLLTQ